MSLLVDTGPLVAWVRKDDPLHEQARSLLNPAWAGRYGQVLTTDYVLDEGFSLIQSRTHKPEVSQAFADLLLESRPPARLEMRHTPADLLPEALTIHLQQYDRRLSFTDSTLIALARHLDAAVATFDRKFHGLVPVAPV